MSEKSIELLRRAGIRLDYSHERKLFATARGGDFRILFVRAKDVPEFVQDGVAHAGITGLDLVRETRRDVVEVMDLDFGSCSLVVAVPEESAFKTAADVPDGTRVATSFPTLTRRFFQEMGTEVEVVEVSGATEITPQVGVAEVITDLTSTGSTLAMNHLRPVATVLDSTAHLIANPAAREEGPMAERLARLEAALRSVVEARGKRYVMANVPPSNLEAVKDVLPGLNGPTVLDLADHGMKAVHAVVDEAHLYDTIHDLQELGATGILVLPIQRLVP